jgi:hypothetical protein
VNGESVWKHNFVVDSEIHDNGSAATSGNNAYLSGTRMAILGNRIERVVERAEHGLRIWNASKTVISENIIRDPMPSKHSLKLHAWGAVTQYVIVAGNRFRGDQWPVSIGPQDSISNELVREVIVERNLIEPYSRTALGFQIAAQDVTLRNNVGDLTGTSADQLIGVGQRGIEPPPDRVKIYQNSVYAGDVYPGPGGRSLTVASVSDGTGGRVYNNLASAPRDTAVLPRVAAGNTAGSNLVLADPKFSSTDPYAGNFLSIAAGSGVIDVGAAVPVFDDLAGNRRPQIGSGTGLRFDVGAYEFVGP